MRLVRLADAALGCGRDPSTLRRWVYAGRLANHGTRRRIMVDLGEVARLCDTPTRRRFPGA